MMLDRSLLADQKELRTSLVLHCCLSFWSRLRGINGPFPQGLSEHQGLFLKPCRAVHTLGLCAPIDVVFVDAALNELKRVDSMAANRMSVCWRASAVIELPAGYCRRFPDYLPRIKDALLTIQRYTRRDSP